MQQLFQNTFSRTTGGTSSLIFLEQTGDESRISEYNSEMTHQGQEWDTANSPRKKKRKEKKSKNGQVNRKHDDLIFL